MFGRCLEGVWDVVGMVGRCSGVSECCLGCVLVSFGSFKGLFWGPGWRGQLKNSRAGPVNCIFDDAGFRIDWLLT